MGYDYPTACDQAMLTMAAVADLKRQFRAFDAITKKAEATAKRFVLGRLMAMVKDGNLDAIKYYLETRTEEFKPENRKPAKDPTKRKK
jgi:hypothetical protein